jgi:class 3 adenylate cyclase
MPPRPLSPARFFAELRRRTPANAKALDRRLLARTERDLAILVSDSSGFTRRTHEEGILHFLSLLVRVNARIIPVLERHRGRVLAQKADNLLAVFDDAVAAGRAAVAVQRAVASWNRGKPPRRRFHLCLGLDAGPVVALDGDVYGSPVNIASKLGEDLAGRGEILATAEFVRRLDGAVRSAYSRSSTIGGRIVEIHRLRT